MADEASNQDRLGAAFLSLKLSHSYESRPSGSGLWHVQFAVDDTVVRLTAYTGPLVAGVLSVVGDLAQGWVPPDSKTLLGICTDLWLTKVLAQDNLVSVTAQLPAEQVDASTLRLAIAGVLEGVRRFRSLPSLDAMNILGPISTPAP